MSHYLYKSIKKQNQSYIPKIKFKTNFTNCILDSFIRRGFQQTQNDDWDIIWSQKQHIPELYEKRILPNQKINHFRNFYQLCRKDNLIRNLKKYKKGLQRQGKTQQAASLNFYPQTYILPTQYVIFADEFKKNQSDNKNVWIMKPTCRSQGKGIFLFNKLSQVSQWQNHSAENYIVQKYISDPLLIGGKKFDIRIYVLVTSYQPLIIYIYKSGFARFTHCRYQFNKLQNSQIHLTNVAIQKNAQGYDETIGGKWYLDKLKSYLLSKYQQQQINNTFLKIQEIIIKTLESMQKIIIGDKQTSFELYGFDILLDSKLQPWLIEVNGSPSMTANTQTDNIMKLAIMDDTITVLDTEKLLTGNQEQIGGFDLVYKGSLANKTKNTSNQPAITQKMSFLGTYNNRIENLKKIAKNIANRVNNECKQRKNCQSLNPTAQLVNARKNNPSRKSAKNSACVPRNAKDFIIKQRNKRDENQPKQIK